MTALKRWLSDIRMPCAGMSRVNDAWHTCPNPATHIVVEGEDVREFFCAAHAEDWRQEHEPQDASPVRGRRRKGNRR